VAHSRHTTASPVELSRRSVRLAATSEFSDWPVPTSPQMAQAHWARQGPTCLIIDDSRLHRENLAAVLMRYGRPESAVAWDFPSVCAALADAAPDIVLVNMDTRDNVTLLRSVRAQCPAAKVIAIGVPEDDEAAIIACAEAGVVGYHLRGESVEDLLALMSRVDRGESSCSPRVSAILLKRLSALAAQRHVGEKELVLTTREIQILRLLELGLSNGDIADRLCIALHTVKNHVHSILGKLGVSTRVEAAAHARTLDYTELVVHDVGTRPA